MSRRAGDKHGGAAADERNKILAFERMSDGLAERLWQAKRQGRKALPRRIGALLEANAELRKEAKGLTRPKPRLIMVLSGRYEDDGYVLLDAESIGIDLYGNDDRPNWLPSRAEYISVLRAVHSIVRKFPQYALAGGKGRTALWLYEPTGYVPRIGGFHRQRLVRVVTSDAQEPCPRSYRAFRSFRRPSLRKPNTIPRKSPPDGMMMCGNPE